MSPALAHSLPLSHQGRLHFEFGETPNAAGIGGDARLHLYLLDILTPDATGCGIQQKISDENESFSLRKYRSGTKRFWVSTTSGCHGGRRTMHPLFLLGKAGCSHPPPPVAVCLVRGSQAPTGWAWGAGTCNYQPNPPSLEAGDGAQPTPPLTLLVAPGKGWDGDKDIFLNSLHADPQQRQTAMLSHLHAPSLPPASGTCHIYTDWFHKTLFKCAFL